MQIQEIKFKNKPSVVSVVMTAQMSDNEMNDFRNKFNTGTIAISYNGSVYKVKRIHPSDPKQPGLIRFTIIPNESNG